MAGKEDKKGDKMTLKKLAYSEQIKHPNWQKKRLEVLELCDFTCQDCGNPDEQLHVHHLKYIKGRMIWEYEVGELMVFCASCHKLHLEIDERIKTEISRLTLDGKMKVHGFLCSFDGPTRPITKIETSFLYSYMQGFVAGKVHDFEYIYSLLER